MRVQLSHFAQSDVRRNSTTKFVACCTKYIAASEKDVIRKPDVDTEGEALVIL